MIRKASHASDSKGTILKMSQDNNTANNNLPIVSCEGCGVCCFHMGYPAFVMPREPMTAAEIEADPEFSKLQTDSRRYAELRSGNLGESWWHELPDNLKKPLLEHMEAYVKPDYDGTLQSFDGPCIWLDMETRQCKNHLHRPNVCRDFETGCGECLQWRDEYASEIR